MTDIIILLIVAVIIGFALKGSIKHFKGEGACCGGGGKGLIQGRGKKVLEHDKMGEIILHIEGMHCDNCRRCVIRALKQIEGVSAEVNLKKKQAVVSYDRPVDERRLEQAVEHVGYTVSSVEKR